MIDLEQHIPATESDLLAAFPKVCPDVVLGVVSRGIRSGKLVRHRGMILKAPEMRDHEPAQPAGSKKKPGLPARIVCRICGTEKDRLSGFPRASTRCHDCRPASARRQAAWARAARRGVGPAGRAN